MSNNLFFFPNYSGGNPYQKLLYKPLVLEGWQVAPSSISNLLQIKSIDFSKTIFHMHWLNAIYSECNDNDEAWDKIHIFINQITKFQKLGGKLIWTIHNHIPHENRFPEQDLRLRYFLAEISDRIHLHCGSHYDELHYLRLNPSKIQIHRHGNYINYYGKFGIEERINNFNQKKPRALFLGMIRGYKNINGLTSIASDLADQGIQVTIAGKCEDLKTEEKLGQLSTQKGVTTILRRLTEHEVHQLCTNNEIGIISYEKILTSGTIKLYLSYAMHIIAPEHKTIQIENRLNTFSMYDNSKPNAPNLSNLSEDEYKRSFISSLFLAQEARWASSLFEF